MPREGEERAVNDGREAVGERFVRRGEFVREWIKAGGETPPLRCREDFVRGGELREEQAPPLPWGNGVRAQLICTRNAFRVGIMCGGRLTVATLPKVGDWVSCADWSCGRSKPLPYRGEMEFVRRRFRRTRG